MGLTVDQLAADRAELTFKPHPAADDTVTVVYRPNAITGAVFSSSRSIREVLPEVLISWDIVASANGSGKPKPLGVDQEALSLVPEAFLSRLWRALVQEQFVGEARGEA